MLYRIIALLFIPLFFWIHRLKIYGRESIPKGAVILAPNHASYYDPPIVGSAIYPEVAHYLAKESLFKQPILSFILPRLKGHPVNLESKTNLQLIKTVAKLVENEQRLVIFPEGERSWDNVILPLKHGASVIASLYDVPVVPIYISGAFEAWPRGVFLPKLWGKMAIVFGSPIYWRDFHHLSRKDAIPAMSEKIKNEMSALKKWYENGAESPIP